MSDRFRVVDIDELKELNPEAAEDYEYGFEYDFGGGEYLYDTEEKVVVWADGHEPEDLYLFRDLRVFVDLLNKLAAEKS